VCAFRTSCGPIWAGELRSAPSTTRHFSFHSAFAGSTGERNTRPREKRSYAVTPASISADDATLLLLARHVLGGFAEEGRASIRSMSAKIAGARDRLVTANCSKCRRQRARWLRAMHNRFRVPRQRSFNRCARARDTRYAARHAPKRAGRDRHPCQSPGCMHGTFIDVHHLETRADVGGHDPTNWLTTRTDRCSRVLTLSHAGTGCLDRKIPDWQRSTVGARL